MQTHHTYFSTSKGLPKICWQAGKHIDSSTTAGIAMSG